MVQWSSIYGLVVVDWALAMVGSGKEMGCSWRGSSVVGLLVVIGMMVWWSSIVAVIDWWLLWRLVVDGRLVVDDR